MDEAHGAHFGMHPYFPEHALTCGADLVINSVHKTLPSLTQTALLHVQGMRVDRERLKRFLGMYQTSSPSYLLMAGIDACVRMLLEHGPELFDTFAKRLEGLRKQLQSMHALELVRGTEPELGPMIMTVRRYWSQRIEAKLPGRSCQACCAAGISSRWRWIRSIM